MAEWIEQKRAAIFLAFIALALGGFGLFQTLRSGPKPELLPSPTPVPTAQATATPSPVRVYVSGAVHLPDVYSLPPGSIVKDALQAAGGATTEADLDRRINLALLVAEGQQVYVPRLGEENPPVPPPASQPSASQIDINTAGAVELETLPGIGPALAQRILDYRQQHGRYSSIEEIMDVSGIGPATFEKLKELITTE